jgi:choline dehydrogenase
VKDFDYVVVGAGTAGCVVAARLTQDPSARVLLLEAGGPERTRAMTVPSAWPENLASPANWGDTTVSQAGAGVLPYPRGRALGGSGAINALAHVRGHRAVYDGWAAAGAAGWGFADLLPCFLRSERADGRDPALRGASGPVRVGPATTGRHPVASAFADALTEAGHPVTDDLSGRDQEGVCWVDLAIADGERVSSADAYLRPVLARENLTVETGCLATRLEVSHGRCTGVSYLRHGERDQAHAAAEVILCAGAVGSPQLLLLSGIGPAQRLRALGIAPVADVAEVGENLQDHPIVLTSYATPSPLPASAYNHGEMYATLRSGELGVPGPGTPAGPAGEAPDLQLFPILLPLAPERCEPPACGYVLVASLVAPSSRGHVRLASADPAAAPLIDPAFLSEQRDLDRLAAGLELVRQAAGGKAFASFGVTRVWPGPAVTGAAELRGYIRQRVGSYHHPAGTCRMGSDGGAVVDPQLRVQGVAGLRVADASIMPVITNAHPNATVLAIAERAAGLISSSAWPAGRCPARG